MAGLVCDSWGRVCESGKNVCVCVCVRACVCVCACVCMCVSSYSKHATINHINASKTQKNKSSHYLTAGMTQMTHTHRHTHIHTHTQTHTHTGELVLFSCINTLVSAFLFSSDKQPVEPNALSLFRQTTNLMDFLFW